MGYAEWRKFENAIERAMIACKNSGQVPTDHFVHAAKMVRLGSGSQRKADNYHLTRYACYLVAMNSDPRKEEVSQAQSYFAMRTRQAELADARQQTPIHTLTDAMRACALENLRRVPEGYFSAQGELFKHLYNLEGLLNQAIVSLAMIEISVGQHWSAYAREVVGVHENVRCKYTHVLQDGREVYAWVYPIQYVNSSKKCSVLLTAPFSGSYGQSIQDDYGYPLLPLGCSHPIGPTCVFRAGLAQSVSLTCCDTCLTFSRRI